MNLLSAHDPLLRTKAAPVTFIEPFDQSIPRKMAMFMDMEGGVGLAAPQLGIMQRFFVMRLSDDKRICVINPEIIRSGKQLETDRERCLSFPGLSKNIVRPRVIDVKFQSPLGNPVTMTLKGNDARVFQHELDHLDGICIIPKDEVPSIAPEQVASGKLDSPVS